MFQDFKYEKINVRYDPQLKLHGVIAVDSTTLGPGLGGIRMRSSYSSLDEVVSDALKLSRAMTYKNALAGLKYGGGKAVIWANPKTDKTPQLLEKIADWVNECDGSYKAAEDMGMEAKDLEYMSQFSTHVAGFSEKFVSPQGRRGGGDPSPMTAYGVYGGIQAALEFNDIRKSNLRFTIQGVGKVGEEVVAYLAKHFPDSQIIITDINEERLQEVAVHNPDIRLIPPEKHDMIYDEPCDVFIPCATGGVLNDNTIGRLKKAGCKIVAGAANNQLENEERHGQMLHEEAILYAPDYAINAGGVINIAAELEQPDGYNAERARMNTRQIADTLKKIFERSHKENIPTNVIADIMAQERLNAAN